MLSTSSNTHNAFFSASANEVIGKINSQYNTVSGYFSLKETNRQLALENAALRNLLKNNYQSPSTHSSVGIDTTVRDTLNRVRKYTYLPATVVNNYISGQNNYISIERGSNQGIQRDMAVVSPLGIVGIVVETSPNYSKVMSLLNRKGAKVSAMLKKDNTSGSIEWDGESADYVTLKNISKSVKVVKGDTVLTSNYSANFPSGLMIGTVVEAKPEGTTNNYIIKVKTATNFHNLQYVNVIKNYYFAEQTALEKTSEKEQ